MQLSSKVLLLAVAIAIASTHSPTALAQETEVEVVDEPSGTPCNPCAVHIDGESHIRAMPANVIVSDCTDEFLLDIYHDGHGELELLSSSDSTPPGCNTVNCVINGSHRPVTSLGELGTGQEHLFVDFCLRAGITEIVCRGEITTQEWARLVGHTYELTMIALCLGGARIWEGHWQTEEPDPDNDGIELVHHV